MKKFQNKIEDFIILYLTHGFLYIMSGAPMLGLVLAVFVDIDWLNIGIAITIGHLPWLIYANRNDLIQ